MIIVTCVYTISPHPLIGADDEEFVLVSPGEVPSPKEAEQLLNQQQTEEEVDGGADDDVSTFHCACFRQQLVVS